jgi:hypothetical protein
VRKGKYLSGYLLKKKGRDSSSFSVDDDVMTDNEEAVQVASDLATIK